MNKFKEYFAGTDLIDRFGKSPVPTTKFKGNHRPFGYCNGKMYVGARGAGHGSIVTDDGLGNTKKNWKFPGQIFDKHNVIYLWKAPTPEYITLFIRDLEKAFDFTQPIVISPDWKIKIKGINGMFKLKDYKKKLTGEPKIRYSTREGTIKLKNLVEDVYSTPYAAADQVRKANVDSPIGSDKELPQPEARELTDSIIQYAKNKLNPNIMKKRILKYKLLGGSLEGIFHVIRATLKSNIQKSVMRDLQNFYLEGPKFSRSGWRRNDLRETYAVGALQLKGSDNSIYIDIENDEFMKLGILDKFSNIKADAWIYADEIDKLIKYLEQAKHDLTDTSVQKPKLSNLRQGF